VQEITVDGQTVFTSEIALPQESNLIHRWKTDESSGTTLTDSVGSKDGTFEGGSQNPTWQTGAGVGGVYLDYDGNDRVNYGNIFISPSEISISVWADTWDGSTFRTVLQQPRDGSSGLGVHIGTDGITGDLRLMFSGTERDDTPTPSGWNMVTFTWDGSTAKFYLNANEIESFSQGLPSWDSGDTFHTGGRQQNNEFWIGGIDDPKIWDVALSSGEVSQMHSDLSGLYP